MLTNIIFLELYIKKILVIIRTILKSLHKDYYFPTTYTEI